MTQEPDPRVGTSTPLQPLRILWPRVDRSHMVAPYYSTLQREVGRRAEVTFVTKKWWNGRGAILGDQNPHPALDYGMVNEHDVLVTDSLFCFLHEDWSKVAIPKVCLVTDAHGAARSYALGALARGFGHFLVRYWAATITLIPELYEQAQCTWLPLEVDQELYYAEGDPRPLAQRSGEALVTGSAKPDVYPLRARMHRELRGMSEVKVRLVGRPDNRAESWPQGRDYIRLLQNHRVHLTDVSIFRYVVLKHIETMAAGTVLLCEWTAEMERLGFEPGTNMLELQPEHDLRAQLAFLMSLDLDALQAIATEGRELVRRRHTGTQRARALVDHLWSLVS